MLTIRLHRTGRKNQPFFKIVVTEKTNSSTRGRFVEELGYYNPLTKEKKLNGERAKYWISKGAQPSDTVHNMLVGDGVIEGKKVPKHKTPKQSAAADATGQKSKKPAPAVAPAASTEAPSAETAKPQETSAPEQKEATPKSIDKS